MLSRFSVILFYLLTIKFTILLFFSLSSALLSLNFGLFDIFVPERDLYQSYYWWLEVWPDDKNDGQSNEQDGGYNSDDNAGNGSVRQTSLCREDCQLRRNVTCQNPTFNVLNSELVHCCPLLITDGDVVDRVRVLHLQLVDVEESHVLIGLTGHLDTVILNRNYFIVPTSLLLLYLHNGSSPLRCTSRLSHWDPEDIWGHVGTRWGSLALGWSGREPSADLPAQTWAPALPESVSRLCQALEELTNTC